MEVGGEVQGDVCARRLRRRRLSWKDRGVRGMEGEGGSKHMKIVVRETIASATLAKGGTLQSPTHTSAKLQQQSTISPHQTYHQETF